MALLTAFGPNTTGVPLNQLHTLQFTKQVFDIGELFNLVTDVAAVRAAYDRVFAAENRYRGGNFTPELALQDAFDTAYRIAEVGLASAPKDGRDELLDAGRKQIESHLVGVKFRREEMKIASAKAALLASALRTAALADFAALRYRIDHRRCHPVARRPTRLPAVRGAPQSLRRRHRRQENSRIHPPPSGRSSTVAARSPRHLL